MTTETLEKIMKSIGTRSDSCHGFHDDRDKALLMRLKLWKKSGNITNYKLRCIRKISKRTSYSHIAARFWLANPEIPTRAALYATSLLYKYETPRNQQRIAFAELAEIHREDAGLERYCKRSRDYARSYGSTTSLWQRR